MVVSRWWLDWVILEVFSNLSDSMFLCLHYIFQASLENMFNKMGWTRWFQNIPSSHSVKVLDIPQAFYSCTEQWFDLYYSRTEINVSSWIIQRLCSWLHSTVKTKHFQEAIWGKERCLLLHKVLRNMHLRRKKKSCYLKIP